MTNRATAIYAFEALDEMLDLVPLAGRRALDRAGKKLSLAAWRSLPLEARRAIVDAGTRAEVPVASVCAALVGATPPPVDIVAPPEPDIALPSLVQSALGAERILDDAAWRALSPLARFALASLASRGRAESLALAYDELLRGGEVSRLRGGEVPSAARGVAGIFVGGASRRMGGTPKGLLLLPSGRTIIDALADAARAAGLEVVLVGRHPAYAALPFPVLDDAPGTAGPLAGLVALLTYAGARTCVALACDAPFVTTPLLQRLLDAPPAIAVAPRGSRGWEPFCARYASADALPVLARLHAEGHSRLQTILDALPATELPLSEGDAHALRDWDTPEDIRRDR